MGHIHYGYILCLLENVPDGYTAMELPPYYRGDLLVFQLLENAPDGYTAMELPPYYRGDILVFLLLGG
jgi:hypothetical protein